MIKKIYKTISAKVSKYAESKMAPIDRLVVLKDKLIDSYEKVAISSINAKQQLNELQKHRNNLVKDVESKQSRFSHTSDEATQRTIAHSILVITRAIEQLDAKIESTNQYIEKLEPIKTDLAIRAENAINQLETARMVGELGTTIDIPSIYDIDRLLVDLDVTVLESGSSVSNASNSIFEVDDIIEKLKTGTFKV